MSTIIMHTSEGDIKINLFDEQTPKTVENFLGLASGKKEWTDPFTGKPSHEAFYDGLTFHRIIKDFMIPQDIDEAKSKVKVVPMKAEQIANTLKAGGDDLSAGVINNDYVADAGLKPTDAIYQDNAESEEARPYINIFAVRADDVNNEVYKKCVEIYQTKPVLDALQEESGGTAVFADKFSQQELASYLKQIETDIKNK